MIDKQRNPIVTAVVASVATTAVMGLLAFFGGALQATPIGRWLTGEVQVSMTYGFTNVPTTSVIPQLADWKFCALTRVALAANQNAMCLIDKQGGKWVHQTGPRDQQVCSVMCWN